jgi:antitoxin ParD1/3/4
LVEQKEAEDTYRLEALRSAVQLGIGDIEEGRFKAFKRPGDLRAYLEALSPEAVEEE